MITNEQRQQALQNANPLVADTYGSLETAQLLSALTEKYGLERGGEHIDIVGDVMLGFYERKRLPELLVSKANMSQETAQKLAQDLSEFFEKLPENTPLEKSKEHEQIEFRPEGTGTNAEDSTKEETEQPITKEELASYLKPKHTMDDDIATLKGTAQEDPKKDPAPIPESPAANSEAASEQAADKLRGKEKEAQELDAALEETKNTPPESERESAIPRYSRPLTDIPKYSEDDATNPQG